MDRFIDMKIYVYVTKNAILPVCTFDNPLDLHVYDLNRHKWIDKCRSLFQEVHKLHIILLLFVVVAGFEIYIWEICWLDFTIRQRYVSTSNLCSKLHVHACVCVWNLWQLIDTNHMNNPKSFILGQS